VEFGVLPNHPPPTTKGGMFAIRRVAPWREIRRRSEGKTEMKFMVRMQFLLLDLGGNTDSSVAGSNLFVFWGDDHGREAVVGRRDANWASGCSTITSSLLLSVFWEVGTFGAD
jgi:hypothetical protein